MKILSILAMITMSVCLTCARVQHATHGTVSDTQETGYQTYRILQATLETCNETMEYDTLMQVYTKIMRAQHEIPHLDQLLYALIDKRNSNPRVDQMILIFSARVIGNSKFQVPHAYDIFEAILKKDDDRINEWVISFVAASIGRYPFDIPNGNGLVDLLEHRQDRIGALNRSESKEFFGFHFLPPPRSAYIVSYLKGIEAQRIREFERAHYYALIQNNITENEIETALRCIRENGTPGTDKPCPQPLKYLLLNRNSLFPEVKKGS